jgi:hypothetical protein
VTATVTQLIPREAAMACPGGRTRTLAGIYDRCGWSGTLRLFEAAAWCPRCGRILRWPKDAAKPAP